MAWAILVLCIRISNAVMSLTVRCCFLKSILMPPGLENQMVIETIKKTGGELVENVFPFDKYKDSIAYRVIFRHPDRTLTEEEVNAKHQEIIHALTSKLAVRIR